jgi:probable addiction module antidote protein
MKDQDPQTFMKAHAEVAKAQGVNKVDQEAGVNRESPYISLKGGAKTRFETVKKLLMEVGLGLSVQPIASNTRLPNFAKANAVVVIKPAAAKLAIAAKPAVPKQAIGPRHNSTKQSFSVAIIYSYQ